LLYLIKKFFLYLFDKTNVELVIVPAFIF